jgi:hypothetical protein
MRRRQIGIETDTHVITWTQTAPLTDLGWLVIMPKADPTNQIVVTNTLRPRGPDGLTAKANYYIRRQERNHA